MARRTNSKFETIFPLIQKTIRELNGTKGIREWIDRDTIAEEIKKDPRINAFYSEYLKKDPPPKKQKSYENWVGNKVDFFSAHFTDELKGRPREMQKSISEFERKEFQKQSGKRKKRKIWAYRVKA